MLYEQPHYYKQSQLSPNLRGQTDEFEEIQKLKRLQVEIINRLNDIELQLDKMELHYCRSWKRL